MSPSWFCSTCCVNWWPYMAIKDACPECGGGLKRTQEPGSLDADARFKVAMAKRVEADEAERKRAQFEAEYLAREIRLNGLDALPVAEPQRPGDVQHGETEAA